MLCKMFENFTEEFLSLPLLWVQSHIKSTSTNKLNSLKLRINIYANSCNNNDSNIGPGLLLYCRNFWSPIKIKLNETELCV